MNIEEIEIHQGKPDFGYQPVRRLQAKVEAVSNFAAAPTLNDGNAKLRELAAKVSADAVIDVEYHTGVSMTSWRSMTVTGLAVRKVSDERSCPVCAETIKKAAIKCRFCGSIVEPELSEPEAEQTTISQEPLVATNNPIMPYVIISLVLLFGLIFALAAS